MRMTLWIAIIGITVECGVIAACGDAWADRGIDLQCPFGGPFSNDDFAAMEKRADGDSCVHSGAWEERRSVVQVFVPCLSAFQSCAIVRFDNATFTGGCFPDASRAPVVFNFDRSTVPPKYDFTQPMRPVSPQVFSLSLGLTCQSIYAEFTPPSDDNSPPKPDQFYCKYGAVSWEGSYRIGRICCCKTRNCAATVLNGMDEVDRLLESTFVGDSLASDDEPDAVPEIPQFATREERVAHAKARTPGKLFDDDVPALTALYLIGIAYGMICAHWTFICFVTVWECIEERRRRVY